MTDQQFYILKSSVRSRKVANPIEPVQSFQSVQGFYCIAHRGASFYAPENTMPAFKKAVAMKADMIELDVTFTRDQVPVVFHDKKLNRTTNGKGNIKNYYERELNDLDAGSWFSAEYAGTKIPRLEDILRWAKGTIALNLEIKKEAVKKNQKGSLEENICSLLDTYEMSDQVVLSSFSSIALKRFQKVDPRLKTSALLSPYSMGSPKSIRKMKAMGAKGLNILPRQMRGKFMKMANEAGIPVWVYTIDGKNEMKRVIRKGATGIFTNRPDILRHIAMEELTVSKM